MYCKTLFPLLLILLAFGCEHYPQDEYREFIAVESYLVAHGDMPPVRVLKTLPLEMEYTLGEAAIPDAFVQIQRLGANGEPEQTYIYEYESRGNYIPNFTEPVLPERRYRLFVQLANGDTLQAETLVPGSFSVTGTVPDSVTYQSDEQITLTATPSQYPGRQTYYLFSVQVDNPREVNLTPFYLNLVTEQDNHVESFGKNSSGIINEENYDRNSDGTVTLRIPWLAIAFYEENEIVTNAIDDNLYDFLRSQSVQTGGTTLPPGEIQNIQYNISGGIGIFGSMASDTQSVYIRRN